MSYLTDSIIQPKTPMTLEQFWELANDTRLETEYLSDQKLQYLQTAPLDVLQQICLQYRYFVRDYPNNLSLLVSKLPYGNFKLTFRSFFPKLEKLKLFGIGFRE